MSRELIQLHIDSCARSHFYYLFSVFFSLQIRPVRVCTGRDIVRVHLYGVRYSPQPCFIARS